MHTVRKILVLTAFSSLVGLGLTGHALAAPITGSDTISASVGSTNESGSNLGSATTIGLGSSTFGSGVGSFSAVSGLTFPLGGTTLDLNNLASFGFISATIGTFAPTVIQVTNKTPSSLNVFVSGAFAPGSLFGGADAPLGASENFGFTQTGGSISVSGTFASPPAAAPIGVPEPLTITLFGAGLIGVGALRRRQKVEKAS